MKPGLSILVVDDEAEYRQLFRILLRDAGHEVDDAASAADALAKLAANTYDLVLSDLVMPNMDGIGLLRAIKAMGVAAEVIIVTGYGSIRNAVEAIRSGAFSYFIKGTDPGELLHEIEKIHRLKQIVRTHLDLNEPLLSASASPKMRQVEHVVEKVAGDRPVGAAQRRVWCGKGSPGPPHPRQQPAPGRPFRGHQLPGLSRKPA